MTGKDQANLGPEAPKLTQEGFTYRDLNKNGKLDPYEDSRQSIDERVEDLLSQMTIEEKAGMIFQTMISMNEDGTLIEEPGGFTRITTSEMVSNRLMNHFNILMGTKTRQMAEWQNRLQKLASQRHL